MHYIKLLIMPMQLTIETMLEMPWIPKKILEDAYIGLSPHAGRRHIPSPKSHPPGFRRRPKFVYPFKFRDDGMDALPRTINRNVIITLVSFWHSYFPASSIEMFLITRSLLPFSSFTIECLPPFLNSSA